LQGEHPVLQQLCPLYFGINPIGASKLLMPGMAMPRSRLCVSSIDPFVKKWLPDPNVCA
jgi:hypothetical protein